MLRTSTIKHPKFEGMITMGERVRVTDSAKLTLLYDRFRDICLVEKEVWKEIFLPREFTSGPNIEQQLDTAIPRGSMALHTAIHEGRAHISFFEKL